jgi:hypothetical protein
MKKIINSGMPSTFGVKCDYKTALLMRAAISLSISYLVAVLAMAIFLVAVSRA